MAYCKRCKKEVEAIGPRLNQCPTCKGFVSTETPKPKKSHDFDSGFSGALQPEDMLKMKRLKQAGYIKGPEDVMQHGLQDMITRFRLDGESNVKNNGDSFDNMMEKFAKLAEQNAKQTALMRMQEMASNPMMGNKPKKDEPDILDMMLKMELIKSMRNQDNSPNKVLEIQLQNMQQQMQQQQMSHQWQQQLNTFQQKSAGENNMFDKWTTLYNLQDQKNREHQSKQEELRLQMQQQQMTFMQEKLNDVLTRMSSEKGWGSELTNQIQGMMGQQFIEYWKTGKFAKPEKSAMDTVGEFVNTLAPAIQTVVQAYSAQKAQQRQPTVIQPPVEEESQEQPTAEKAPTQNLNVQSNDAFSNFDEHDNLIGGLMTPKNDALS